MIPGILRRTARRGGGLGRISLGLIALIVAGEVAVAALAPPGAEGCRIVKVTDGDTLRAWCPDRGVESVRLTGFDTPELFSAQCLSEWGAAMRSALSLRLMLARADRWELRPNGTDRYGRRLADLSVDGEPVAARMVRDGLARAYDGGRAGATEPLASDDAAGHAPRWTGRSHMFSRILIANRGEIACRVIDTCRRMGVETVAVHSTADAGARHVAMADLAVAIGGPDPSESYLRGDRIVAAALETGAQAIHPGYGFLSENPGFVDAVEAAGLVFVGPPAEAMRQMGLKDAAKAAMEAAGVPVVPGYHGADQDDARLAREAEQIGWPVMIKAVAGGGGKGMRLVGKADDFADALASARSEAKGAFGNDAVLIEKAIGRPRHIEIQVFGDGTRAVHLFERDCSLQRRHQKVIEESPAPGMDEAMRTAMGDAAVRAAEAIGYRGAGTVEFIVDGGKLSQDAFYFMEMNTRLQVEHPVTEAVTGVDLVEWQLRVASGEGLPARQEDLSITGHAVEARLYAEDAANGFLPVTGRIAALSFPDGLRVETGVRSGDTVTPHYDPMIAKLIAHGPTRDVALQRLSDGLGRTRVSGTVTNLPFLKRLLDHADVRAGRVETGLIGDNLDNLTRVVPPTDEDVALAVLAAAGLDGPGAALQGFALWDAAPARVVLEQGDSRIDARIVAHGPDRRTIFVQERRIEAHRLAARWRIGQRLADPADRFGNRVAVGAHVFQVVDPLEAAAPEAGTGDVVLAPMPGRVARLAVAPGDLVEEGQVLAVLEAMKMEHALKAPRDGEIAECLAAEGAQVEAGAALIRLAGDENKE